jgi:phage terminase large subunit-like protein
MTTPIRQLALDIRERVAKYGESAIDELYDVLDTRTLDTLSSCWQMYARHNQVRPSGCKPIWVRSCGRGEGKTRSAAEETLDICEDWGATAKIILCSKTIGDVRKVMIGGESGLVSCANRRGYEVRYIPSHSMVYHPSGAVMYLVTAEKPDMARGLQCNYFWLDEVSSWQNAMESFDNILLSWRLPAPGGKKGIVTTTPKPNPIMQRLIKKMDDLVTVTYGRTADNAANLAGGTLEQLEGLYLGTRFGRQELEGELIEGQGAMVTQDVIHQHRVREAPSDVYRRVVALDPSITPGGDSDAAGIVVVGCDSDKVPHAFVLEDCSLESATFADWARAAVKAFVKWDCECIIAEVNQGGNGILEAIQVEAVKMSQELRREVVVPVKPVWAKASKKARAEPVGALYERGRVHHVGIFGELEKELVDWIPGFGMDSPNRLDAVVYGVSHLLLGEKQTGPLWGYLSGK